MNVSNSENFFRAESNKSTTSTNSVRGEQMQLLWNRKTTEKVCCIFNCVMKYQNTTHREGPLIQRRHFSTVWSSLMYQKSDALFRDTIVNYIEVLQKKQANFRYRNTVAPWTLFWVYSVGNALVLNAYNTPTRLFNSVSEAAKNSIAVFFLF